MTGVRRWSSWAAVLIVVGGMVWMAVPVLRARMLVPDIHAGIIDHFEEVGPGASHQEAGVFSRHYRFGSGGPGFPGYVLHADVEFWIQQSNDVQVTETFSATYEYQDGQWVPSAVSHTTGWGSHVVTEEVPLGRWSHFLP